MSFMKNGAGGKQLVEHSVDMPYVPGPEDDNLTDVILGDHGPIISRHIDISNNDSPYPHTKKTRQWTRARGKISDEGGREAHLAAICYISDHFFIGTVSRVHKLWRIPASRTNRIDFKVDEDVRKALRNGDGSGKPKEADTTVAAPVAKPEKQPRPVVSMMVSLDHTIYFHDPRGFRADEWVFTEMDSPWSGDGRGLVTQRIFTREGKLIATCIQEVRLWPSFYFMLTRDRVLCDFIKTASYDTQSTRGLF
jgi:acyl-CoA thioesterase 8